jgi:hypothetical protein
MDKIDEGEFAIYIDDSGSPKPDPKDQYPFFAMGGVLIKRNDEQIIKQLVSEFKSRWPIPQEQPLHGNEIRSRKKGFAWLGKLQKSEQDRFLEDLTLTIITCPIIVHACVVSRQGYLNRYLKKYDEETWEMMRSAFSIVVERTAKYAGMNNGSLMVYFEAAGRNEDSLLKQYFHDLRAKGHPFDASRSDKYSPLSAEDLSNTLRGIDSKTKANAIMQIADLCLYPIVRSKDNPDNQAFLSLKNANLLVDFRLTQNQINTLGIKYYCFDNP